jgi:DNA-binding transcriptional regulator YhcF (GntR family)
MKKKFLIPGLAIFVMLGINIFALSAVYAQDTNLSYPPTIQRLAERFNLNPAEVQNVFRELHDEKEADMEAIFEEKLDDLVKEGKLTEDQKQKILDKHSEMRDKLAELWNLDPAERREKSEAIHQEFRAWAEAEGIDLNNLWFFGKHMGGKFKDGFMMGMMH